MQMERFGADKILNTERGTYTDEDIYALISKDEERTEAVNAKIKTDDKYNLATAFEYEYDDFSRRRQVIQYILISDLYSLTFIFQIDYSKKSSNSSFID